MMCNLPEGCRELNGAARRQIELIVALSKFHKVVLLGDKREQFLNNHNIMLIKADVGKRGNHSYTYSWFLCGVENKEKIKRQKPDLAVAWGAEQALLFRLMGQKNIVTCNREDSVEYFKIYKNGIRHFPRWLWICMLDYLTVFFSKKIIVQCDYDCERILSRHKALFYLTDHKVEKQINNINPSWMSGIRRNENRKNKMAHFDLARPKLRIAFLTAFDKGDINTVHRKGNHILFPAVCRLIDEGYDLRLIVAGKGESLNKFKDYYKKYEQIEFVGFADNKEVYAKADISVTPSLIDSCPNALLEAISAGIPAYGSDVSGIRDILRCKEYLFDPTQDGVYTFLKEVLDSKRYLQDREKQKEIYDRLSFDWGYEMSKKIIGQ